VILDEPTAALDTIAERKVTDAVRRLRAGRTTFVIAHRLSTVRTADRILVMDEGRIVAEGTQELQGASLLYRQLVDASAFTPERSAGTAEAGNATRLPRL
jgi:ABC-type multidrug transport system fused ATPase/permease subunit